MRAARRGASPKARSRKDPELFINRELSWLAFNARVIEEAADPSVPLLDRLRFAIIASTNLDEFFMVRVAAVGRAVEEGDTGPDPAGLRPRQLLDVVSARAHEMVDGLGRLYTDELLPGLAQQGVRILPLADLDPVQRSALGAYFRAEVLPALTPLAIDASRPFPLLSNLSVNLAVCLAPAEGEADVRLAVVQVPSGVSRLVRLPGAEGSTYVLLEDVIRAELATLFEGQTIHESAAFRVTRDAELELDDEGGRPYLEQLEAELKKRRTGEVVRLEVQAGVGSELVGMLSGRTEVTDADVYTLRHPLDMRALSLLVDLPALEHVREPVLKPLPSLDDRQLRDVFAVLHERDVLLHHPYDAFDPVVALVSSAASDPDVLAIKQTLYRTSGDSPVVQALSRAAESGKQVTVLVELMARFDEQSNIRWARRLEEAGAHVIYGIRGYKTHAKICLVVRRGRHGIERYVHLGTGNYNDRTARLYTDFGLMTADAAVGEDASAFFNTLTGYSDPPRMKKLAMAPTGLRDRIVQLIERERRRAEEGQAAEIRAKMNALADEDIIRALYAASQAGVRILLNVRGVCCLRPGLKGVSETIAVVSVVDRFLEHSRVLYFRNGGDEEVYLSSADWMPRNLDRRIELLFPVPVACRQKALDALDAAFLDNVKARALLSDGSYRRQRPTRGEEACRSQLRLYEQTRRAAERVKASEGPVFEPVSRAGSDGPSWAR